jgi:hypothetical protein
VISSCREHLGSIKSRNFLSYLNDSQQLKVDPVHWSEVTANTQVGLHKENLIDLSLRLQRYAGNTHVLSNNTLNKTKVHHEILGDGGPGRR